jgi:hypothetical protein
MSVAQRRAAARRIKLKYGSKGAVGKPADKEMGKRVALPKKAAPRSKK